jgi:hypothetical protein
MIAWGSRIGGLIVRLKFRGWLAFAVGAAMLLGGGAVVASAPASPPRPPINDAYINSLELNKPQTKLNRTATLKSVLASTASATVQSNIFNPCGQASCPPGPREITSCHGVSYGNTVWYDFYPDADGQVSIRTSGYDNVITLYRFSLKTLLPDARHRQCEHESSFPTEQLIANVQKGKAYTFQIGAVNGGGPLQMLFDYFVTPRKRVTASSTLTARAQPNGIQVLGLSVNTARKARVEVNCGPFCRPQAKSGHAVETFPHLNGLQLPSGAKLQIRVSRKHEIGTLIQYTIKPGNFAKQLFCMEPGSRKPRRTCH